MGVFEVNDLDEIAERYDGMISDRVKDVFVEYPDRKQLVSYAGVWLAQLKKHPFTYLRVYWEHCSGYFDPFKKCYEDIIGWYTILDGQSRTDEYLDIHFVANRQGLRDGLKNWSYCLYGFPLTGWLYHTGVYTGIIVLLVCTVSPLNASVRYYLPVMAAAPVYIGCCMGKNARKCGEAVPKSASEEKI